MIEFLARAVLVVIVIVLVSYNLYEMLVNASLVKKVIDVDSEPVKEVYVKWNEDSNFIMAFIAEHFKTSNTFLMDELSIHLGRSTSSLKRKISRLRGIKTNKSPYASDVEREFVQSLDGSPISDEGYAKLFTLALINIGLTDSDIMNLQDLMIESEQLK
mgnify:CR=1 FL=1|tara:strand:- start:75 stop:551 length:477 start_codon:yes stop_codon:yes gene_type:complete